MFILKNLAHKGLTIIMIYSGWDMILCLSASSSLASPLIVMKFLIGDMNFHLHLFGGISVQGLEKLLFLIENSVSLLMKSLSCHDFFIGGTSGWRKENLVVGTMNSVGFSEGHVSMVQCKTAVSPVH